MLVLVSVGSLYVHPILRLKLLEKLAIVLLHIHVFRPLHLTVHAIGPTIISFLVQHLLRATRIKIFHPDIFLLLLTNHVVSTIHDVDCLVSTT